MKFTHVKVDGYMLIYDSLLFVRVRALRAVYVHVNEVKKR